MNNSRAVGSWYVLGEYTTSSAIYAKKFEPHGKFATAIKDQASITLNTRTLHRKTEMDKLPKSRFMQARVT